MKRKTKLWIGGLGLAGLLWIGYLWYSGFVPLASGPGRAGIRHALNIGSLPWSLNVNSSEIVPLPDYIFEADFNVSPDDFARLLAGREFRRDAEVDQRNHVTDAHLIQNYAGFEYAETWGWSYLPQNHSISDFNCACTIYVNKVHDHVLVSYIAGHF